MTLELDARASALGGRKNKQLFEALVAAGGAVVSRTSLARHLWGDAPPRDVANSLATYVCVLRNRLEPGVPPAESVIAEEGDGFRFTLAERRQFARAV